MASCGAGRIHAETVRLWDIRSMQHFRWIALVLGLALLLPSAASAAEWGGITPGETILEQVRERYGAPSKETKQKVDNYDTITWIYEGAKAPAGMNRMVVDFGILKPDGFKPTVVRIFVLEPKPGIFALQTVLDGWGLPSASGDQNGYPTLLYEVGLLAVFNKETLWAESLTFTVPQPLPAAASGGAPAPSPPAPKPGPTPPAGPRP